VRFWMQTMTNGEELAKRSGQMETVLIVEDEVLVRLAIADCLRECGYKVIEAATSDEAVQVLQEPTVKIDVILCDVSLPGGFDGFGLAQWVRAHRNGLPIILVGSPAGASDAAGDLCDSGPMLAKPYDPQLVLDRIKRLLAELQLPPQSKQVAPSAPNRPPGRIRDISLSGAAILADPERAMVTETGQTVRLFMTEVGFVEATVVRQSGRIFAVRFNLPPSVERDLLIRKLFTRGINTTEIEASAMSVTAAVLGGIVTTRTMKPRREAAGMPQSEEEKLPAESLVMQPEPQVKKLAEFGAERQSFAA